MKKFALFFRKLNEGCHSTTRTGEGELAHFSLSHVSVACDGHMIFYGAAFGSGIELRGPSVLRQTPE